MGTMGREISPGARLTEHLTLVRALGRGAMGQVWIAKDTRLGQHVAIKFMAYGRERDPASLARFEREFATAAGIDSPHVIRMYDHSWTEEGVPYIVMELLEGESLEQRLERDSECSLAEIARVLRQAGDALDAAHASGVVHRDIKPDNIILIGDPSEMNLKLLDFGLAKTWSRHTLTGTGVAMGTPDYMSPEQVLGAKHVDHRADLWSLGVVVYRMLCGDFPFHAATVNALMFVICRGAFRPPSEVGGPAAFDPFFERAFEPERTQRFASATEMLAAFEQIAATVPRLLEEDTDTAVFGEAAQIFGELLDSTDDSAVTRLLPRRVDDEGSCDSVMDTNPILLKAHQADEASDSTTDTNPILLKAVQADRSRDADSAGVPVALPEPADHPPASQAQPGKDRHRQRMVGRAAVPVAVAAPRSSPTARDGPTPAPAAAPPPRRGGLVGVAIVAMAAAAAIVLAVRYRVLDRLLYGLERSSPVATASPSANGAPTSSSGAPPASAPTLASGAVVAPDLDAGQLAGQPDAGADDPADAGEAPTGSAYLSIQCWPGCQVWLGSESLGESPVIDKPLPPGKHRVVVYRAPVGSKVLKLDLEPGEHASYEVTMRRPAGAGWPTAGPVPTGPASASTQGGTRKPRE